MRVTPLSSMNTSSCFSRAETPVGSLLLVGVRRAQHVALSGLYFDSAPHAARAVLSQATQDDAAFVAVLGQLQGYFKGERRSFDVPLEPVGTAFQRQVWRALAEIPYGETTTYAAIARSIGNPNSVRAVGAANGKNPISIIVPCHRVVGADGTLTGYAGGLPNKRRLLELEASFADSAKRRLW